MVIGHHKAAAACRVRVSIDVLCLILVLHVQHQAQQDKGRPCVRYALACRIQAKRGDTGICNAALWLCAGLALHTAGRRVKVRSLPTCASAAACKQQPRSCHGKRTCLCGLIVNHAPTGSLPPAHLPTPCRSSPRSPWSCPCPRGCAAPLPGCRPATSFQLTLDMLRYACNSCQDDARRCLATAT